MKVKFVSQCCVCHKYYKVRWIEMDSKEKEITSHGYCPECGKKVLEELDGIFKKKGEGRCQK